MSHTCLAQQICKSDEDKVHLASTPHCVCIHEWPSPPTHTGSPEQGDEQSVSVYKCSLFSLPFSNATKGAICSHCLSWWISRSQSSPLRTDLRLGQRSRNPIRSGWFLRIKPGVWKADKLKLLDKEPHESFNLLGGIQLLWNCDRWGKKAITQRWMWRMVMNTDLEPSEKIFPNKRLGCKKFRLHQSIFL